MKMIRLAWIALFPLLMAGIPSAQDKPAGEAFPEMRKLWDRTPIVFPDSIPDTRMAKRFQEAGRNGLLGAEGLYRCRKFTEGWLAHTDPKTGLLPRGLGKGKWIHDVETSDVWNGRDAGADNYPYMVLTASLIDRPLFAGRMLDILKSEIRHCTRIDRLADNFRFSTGRFLTDQPILEEIIFDNAEFVKDGLIPLTEWLGKSPWSDRAVAIIEDIWKNAAVETPFGKIPTLNFEVNGDLLQSCSRLYWFTGERKFLDWAIRLGDYYLLGDQHPTRNRTELRLRDHGCEVINGLTELYTALKYARPEKAEQYRQPIGIMLDRILEVGRNEHGMLYNVINPQTGEHSQEICDTWGYNYDGFYTLYLLDGIQSYRLAVRKALENLNAYRHWPWEGKSADGYADSIESAINLYRREPVEAAGEWIDSEIRVMWAKQQPTGIIEGWHGDGNFARTTILYVLWKSQGLHVEPWREDVRVGAVRDGESLLISLSADRPWKGRILFDRPRHQVYLHLPLDYPRINQSPEWYTVVETAAYGIHDFSRGKTAEYPGKSLTEGLSMAVPEKSTLHLKVVKK